MDGRDLLLEEDLDAEIGEDELYARAMLASEMLAADVQNAEQAAQMADEEETAIGRNYALTEISTALTKQLEDMSEWRTEVKHCCYCFASAVTFCTAGAVRQSGREEGCRHYCGLRQEDSAQV